MIRRVAAFFLLGQLLIGSTLLPLGDFSALRELPRMYQTYEKVVSPDEKGILDFVGDYLLGGKDMLGHNQHDHPSKPGDFHFQHTTSFSVLFQATPPVCYVSTVNILTSKFAFHLPGVPSHYTSSLFRPPLA